MDLSHDKNDIINRNDKILITGAGGFLGHHVVSKLLEHGFTNIRCLVMSSASLASLESIHGQNQGSIVEILQGNLCSRDHCADAVKGAKVILHLAAGADGKSYAGSFMKSVITTRNLIEAALEGKDLVRFVNIGSFASYSNIHMKRYALLDETCPIVSTGSPDINPYTFAKTEQDNLVIQYGNERNLPWVILRPGAIYGPGVREWITSRVGIDTFGFFMHLGGKNPIPLTYVENCAEMVILAGLKPGIERQVFNVVDDDLPKSKDFLKLYKKNVRHFFSLTLPYRLFYLFSFLWEKYSLSSKGQIPLAFSRNRTSVMWKGNTYSNDKAKALLGWTPKYSYSEATERYFQFLRNRMTEENAC